MKRLTYNSITASRLLLCVLALLVLSAALATAYHFHLDPNTTAECPICKSADDLSAGNSHQTLSVVPLEIFLTNSPIDQTIFVYIVYIDLKQNRAPPV